MLRDEVLAVGRDCVDILQHFEPLEVVVVVQPMLSPTISSILTMRNG